MRKIVIVLLVLAVLFGARKMIGGGGMLPGMGAHLENEYPPGSPLHDANQAFVDRVNANPKILALFDGAHSKDALYLAWNDALRAGAVTLPADRLVAVARTEVAIMARLPEASCAKLMHPRDSFDQALTDDIRAAVQELPARHHQVMANFTYDALEAKVNQAPAIPVDPQELGYALQSLGQQYSGVFGERLSRVMANPVAASDEDACWAVNSILNSATQLSPAQAEALRRTFLGARG
jgi:hypothetical protein